MFSNCFWNATWNCLNGSTSVSHGRKCLKICHLRPLYCKIKAFCVKSNDWKSKITNKWCTEVTEYRFAIKKENNKKRRIIYYWFAATLIDIFGAIWKIQSPVGHMILFIGCNRCLLYAESIFWWILNVRRKIYPFHKNLVSLLLPVHLRFSLYFFF